MSDIYTVELTDDQITAIEEALNYAEEAIRNNQDDEAQADKELETVDSISAALQRAREKARL